jgi:hypothetical protein
LARRRWMPVPGRPQAGAAIRVWKVSGFKGGKIFRFPGLNVVWLIGISGANLRFFEKPQATRGGAGKVA